MKYSIAKKISRVSVAALLVILSIVIVLPQPAKADATTPGTLQCVANAANCALYLVTIFINLVAKFLISIAASFVNWGLKFSTNAVNLTGVQTGFGITLSIANLGFIL